MSLNRLEKLSCFDRKNAICVDLSHLSIEPEDLDALSPLVDRALDEMRKLEGGEKVNTDEGRQVGHYWLRAPELAPCKEFTEDIHRVQKDIEHFCAQVHSGSIAPERATSFQYLLLIGIGGSALGPQFLYDAFRSPLQKMPTWFFDNTDPDGFATTLSQIPNLAETLVVVISKSGGTKETANGMKIAEKAFAAVGLDFSRHAVAVTGEGSLLDTYAKEQKWISRFPLWDWVGGRTSVSSVVGLLPLALQGSDTRLFLQGMAHMDELTRNDSYSTNPALLLALGWYKVTKGKGEKAMVVLPYKDRLLLCSRYLQQLVMESLGKELDREGNVVHQGLSVYGNKGSTDQHAYIQQLREGLNDFFVTFIEVYRDVSTLSQYHLTHNKKTREMNTLVSEEVADGLSAGDYLAGFLHGTRKALSDNKRESITISIKDVDEYNVGML
ncbi:MAG: hypothetical protein KDD55_08900, partial [Bdellovibrionales bacterium]|nr:hypothetical protein [Bdellovibrionales bacterium]